MSTATFNTWLNPNGTENYKCRAWVNFNGTNGSIRASGNVSSVTRLSAGTYTVNFSSSMPDVNYCPVFGVVDYGSDQTPTVADIRGNTSNNGAVNMSTTSVDIRVHATNSASNPRDMAIVTLSVFR
jgi:hypothetical protein